MKNSSITKLFVFSSIWERYFSGFSIFTNTYPPVHTIHIIKQTIDHIYLFKRNLYQKIIKKTWNATKLVIIKFAFNAYVRVSFSWTSVFKALLISSINFNEFILSLDKIFHCLTNIFFYPFIYGYSGEIDSHGIVSYPWTS